MTTADWPERIARRVGWLRRLVGRHLRDAHEAEDVVQEVVAAAVARRPGSPAGPNGDIDRWLCGLALNQVRMYRRSAGRRRRREESAARPESEPDCPLERMLRAERDGLLGAAVAGLGPDDARLLEWKYGQGWGYDKIAARLGVSRDVVAHRLRAARARLRASLDHTMSRDEP